MELKVVVSGQPIGDYAPDGCSLCHNLVPVGEFMVLYADGEYWPTFCVPCVTTVTDEIKRRTEAMLADTHTAPESEA